MLQALWKCQPLLFFFFLFHLLQTMCPSWHIHPDLPVGSSGWLHLHEPQTGTRVNEKPGENKVDLQKRQLMSKEKGSGGNCCSPQGQNHLILQCCGYFRNHVLMVHFPHHLPALNACKIVGRVWLPFAFNAIGFSHKSVLIPWKLSESNHFGIPQCHCPQSLV